MAFHEIGHMADDIFSSLFQKKERRSLTQYSSEEIARVLSQYAIAALQECVAEASPKYSAAPRPAKLQRRFMKKFKTARK